MEIRDLFAAHQIEMGKEWERAGKFFPQTQFFNNIPAIMIGSSNCMNVANSYTRMIAGKLIIPSDQTKDFIKFINGSNSYLSLYDYKNISTAYKSLKIRDKLQSSYHSSILLDYSDAYNVMVDKVGDYNLVSIMMPHNTYGMLQSLSNCRNRVSAAYLYTRHPYESVMTKQEAGQLDNTTYAINALNHVYNTDRQYVLDSLFAMLNRHSALPIIKDWCPYIMDDIVSNIKTYLQRGLHVYHAIHCDAFLDKLNIRGCSPSFNAKLKQSYLINADAEKRELIQKLFGFYDVIELQIPDDIIGTIISSGLEHHDITIDGCTETSAQFARTHTMDDYVANYGASLTHAIQGKFTPKFIPDQDKYNNKLNDICDIMSYHTDVDLYPAQRNAVQAMANHLKTHSYGLISAEMGSGKTAIAISTVYTAAKRKNYSAIVMAPASMVLNWQDEINRLSPFSETVVVNSIAELDAIKEKLLDKNRKRALWVIISSSVAKLSYALRPAVNVYTAGMYRDDNGHVYRNNYPGFDVHCPHCGRVLGAYANPKSLNSIVKQKAHCPSCHAALYTPYFKASANGWINIKNFGWLPQKYVSDALSYMPENSHKFKSAREALLAYESSPDICTTSTEFRRYSLALYIKKHLNKLFDFAVFDEVHQLASNSQQGQAFADIAGAAKKSIALTGTLSNGYANGLFYYLYRVAPKAMKEHGYAYTDQEKFQEDYGVQQITYRTIFSGGYMIKGEAKHSTKNLPGVSPLLFTDYLIDNSAFLLLEDITKDIVSYNEYPIGVEMDNELKTEYDQIATNIEIVMNRINSAALAGVEKGNNNTAELHSAINFLYQYLDQPYGLADIRIGDSTIKINDLDDEKLRRKEEKLIELCRSAVDNGEKVLVFCQWTGVLAIMDRLKDILNDAGLRADIMGSNIKPALRQKYLIERAATTDIMIMNPRLIEVGLNLLDYTTTIFYELPGISSTVRQSNRRAWRLNQTKPVSVYYLYYANTVQQDFLSIISQKIKAAENLEGNFNNSGLSEMGESKDIMALVAGNLAKHANAAINTNNFTQSELKYNEEMIARLEKHKKRGQRKTATVADIANKAFKKRPSVALPDFAAFA